MCSNNGFDAGWMWVDARFPLCVCVFFSAVSCFNFRFRGHFVPLLCSGARACVPGYGQAPGGRDAMSKIARQRERWVGGWRGSPRLGDFRKVLSLDGKYGFPPDPKYTVYLCMILLQGQTVM